MTHEQMARVIRHEEQERLIGMIEWYKDQIDNKECIALCDILIETLEHNEKNTD